MESNFSKIDKKTIPRICFLFSLYIGDHTEDDQDMYFFLGDHIRTCFQKFSKKLSNQSDKTVFLSYLESLLDDPKSYISNFNSGDMAQRLQVLQKIIYVLDPSWAKDFYQEYIRICFKVLLKIYRVNSEPKKRHVKHRSKVPEEDRLISVEEESKENLMETTKFKPLDTENNKYCELDFRIQNNESGEEKEIKGKLIAAIVIRLANIKRSVRTEDLNNNIYSFDFVKLLKALIIKFNDKCRIALTSGEVAEIFSTIDLKFHQEILEILFPVLILETQLELVSQFEFDPIEENKIQVFD